MRWSCLALIAAVGCGSKPVSTDPIELIPAVYLTTMQLVDLHDGDPVTLEFPPQGGRVLFIGARARHVDEDVITLRARLRSLQDMSIIGEEARDVTFSPSPEDPTLKIPDLRSFSNVSNVPICPSYSGFDLFDQPFTLEVSVTEQRSKRTGSVSTTVVPSCTDTDAAMLKDCKCQCAANYVLGKCN